MFNQVIVGVDGNDGSRDAIELGPASGRKGRRADARVRVLGRGAQLARLEPRL